jgi:putative transposase
MDQYSQKRKHAPRLESYDYSTPGAYFVTVCVKDGLCVLGNVANEKVDLTEAGKMIQKWWSELESKFPSIELDEYTIMPNHVHGIISIVGADLCVRPSANLDQKKGAHIGAPLQTILQWFKTMATNEYIRGVKQLNWPPFSGKLWQRSYYDHIIRNDNALDKIRRYISQNPAQWEQDHHHPSNQTTGEPADEICNL